MTSAPDLRSVRLAELVAELTGEDVPASVEATGPFLAGGAPHVEPLRIVARAMLDLGQSSRSLRVTRYLESAFEPVIDLRQGNRRDIDSHEDRFDRAGRSRRVPDRPAGTDSSGFVTA
jgi:hypothetical protein